MVRAILRTIGRLLAGIGRVIEGTLGLLFGSGAAPHLPTDEYEKLVDDEVDELRQDLARTPRQPSLAIQTLGEKIHAYAVADAHGRAAFDLDSVPDHIGLTLLSITDAQLAKLAAAGPSACGRWGLGERSGLVDLPACSPRPKTAEVVGRSVTADIREPALELSLAA